MVKVNLDELEIEPKKNLLKNAEKKAVQRVVTQKKVSKGKKRLGRPQKSEAERLSEKVTVNFTKAEYENLKVISKERFNMALPQLVRLLLKEKGVI